MNRNGITENDKVILILGAPIVLAALAPVALSKLDGLAEWLVERSVLVDQPLIAVPGAAGAGLDLIRIVALGLAFVGLAATTVLAISRLRRPDVDDL